MIRIGAALILLSLPVFGFAADGLSYNYVQASYVKADLGDVDIDNDPDGFNVQASGLAGENVFVFAGYSDIEASHTETFQSGSDSVTLTEKYFLSTVTAGIGYRMALDSKTDLTASVAAVMDELDADFSVDGFANDAIQASIDELADDLADDISDDDIGFGFGLGLRHLFTPKLEGGAEINYVDIYDDDTTSLTLLTLFHATPELSIGAGYTFGDDVDSWTAGARVNFR